MDRSRFMGYIVVLLLMQCERELTVEEAGFTEAERDCPLCGRADRTPVQIRVDHSIPGCPRYVCGACHHRWPTSEALAAAR